jgi:hypothetical protein
MAILFARKSLPALFISFGIVISVLCWCANKITAKVLQGMKIVLVLRVLQFENFEFYSGLTICGPPLCIPSNILIVLLLL